MECGRSGSNVRRTRHDRAIVEQQRRTGRVVVLVAARGQHGCSHEERHDAGIYLC